MNTFEMNSAHLQNLSRTECSRLIELCLRMNLRLCLHVEISSLRLFTVAMCGLVIRKNFSGFAGEHTTEL